MPKRKTLLTSLLGTAVLVPGAAIASSDAEKIAELRHAVPENGELTTIVGAIAGTLGPAERIGLPGMSVAGADGEKLGMTLS